MSDDSHGLPLKGLIDRFMKAYGEGGVQPNEACFDS